MELFWALLIFFGIVYGCFCINKRFVIVIYGIMLMTVNIALILSEKTVVNRCLDIFVSLLVFIALCFSYYIRYTQNNILDKVVYKIISYLQKMSNK